MDLHSLEDWDCSREGSRSSKNWTTASTIHQAPPAPGSAMGKGASPHQTNKGITTTRGAIYGDLFCLLRVFHSLFLKHIMKSLWSASRNSLNSRDDFSFHWDLLLDWCAISFFEARAQYSFNVFHWSLAISCSHCQNFSPIWFSSSGLPPNNALPLLLYDTV